MLRFDQANAQQQPEEASTKATTTNKEDLSSWVATKQPVHLYTVIKGGAMC
jgi:hypothetical protein